MGRIKGWKKIETKYPSWILEDDSKYGDAVDIEVYEWVKGKNYSVGLNIGHGPNPNWKLLRDFKSKEKGITYAVEWMRKHPKG